MSQTPAPPSRVDDVEREKLLVEMEKELARPRVGVWPPVALFAMLAGLAFAYWVKADAEYFFSSHTPIELGAEGEYHFEKAISNRYAQVHGVPTARGWYVEEKEGSAVVIGVSDTSLLVKRVTFDDEKRRLPDSKRPQPRQNSFFARGRLLSRAEASKYDEVFREYEAWSGIPAQWLLLTEHSPGQDYAGVSFLGLVLLFVALNGWLFIRGIAPKHHSPKASSIDP